MLDSVEHEKLRYTIVRRGKAVAHLEPVTSGRGLDIKAMLRRHRLDERWSEELDELRGLVEIEDR